MMTSGRSAFAAPGERIPRFSPIGVGRTFDVVIVGAGITGITTAHQLAMSGLSIAVIDAGRVGGGATAFSTGQLTAMVDAGYARIESDFGADAAKLVATATTRAMSTVEDLVGGEKLSCAMRRVPLVHYAETDEQARELEEEIAAAARAGLGLVHVGEETVPFPVKRVYRLEHQLEIDPSAYVQELARALPANVALFEDTRVVSIHEGSPFVLETERGEVRADWVVEATHVPGGRNSFHARTAPYRSYVIAAKSGAKKLSPGIYTDVVAPYHYWRAHKGLVLLGGADHKTGQREEGAAPFAELESHLRERMDVGEIAARWTTELYTPVDGLPYIGPMANGSRHLVATGFDGDGLLFGSLAGEILAHRVLGIRSAIGELLDPSRTNLLASASKFVKEQVNVAFHLVHDRISDVASSADGVALGQGAIVDLDGTRCAVFRDEDGKLHVRSATCPHAGCVVQWNSDAKTFDCPCHGGCFSPHGRVLGGPPATDLAVVEGYPPDDERDTPLIEEPIGAPDSVIRPIPTISAQ